MTKSSARCCFFFGTLSTSPLLNRTNLPRHCNALQISAPHMARHRIKHCILILSFPSSILRIGSRSNIRIDKSMPKKGSCSLSRKAHWWLWKSQSSPRGGCKPTVRVLQFLRNMVIEHRPVCVGLTCWVPVINIIHFVMVAIHRQPLKIFYPTYHSRVTQSSMIVFCSGAGWLDEEPLSQRETSFLNTLGFIVIIRVWRQMYRDGFEEIILYAVVAPVLLFPGNYRTDMRTVVAWDLVKLVHIPGPPRATKHIVRHCG